MKNATKGKILRGAAVGIDVGVPLAATISQFPVWIERDVSSTISGLFLLLTVISCIPFYRQIREYFKSPSVTVLWTIMFVLFALLENIASELKIVCFFGAVANYIGAAVYSLGTNISNREDNIEEEA